MDGTEMPWARGARDGDQPCQGISAGRAPERSHLPKSSAASRRADGSPSLSLPDRGQRHTLVMSTWYLGGSPDVR